MKNISDNQERHHMTKTEQLQNKATEIWKLRQFHNHQIRELEKKKLAYLESWFYKQWKVDHFEFLISEYKKIDYLLGEYQKLIEEIQTKDSPEYKQNLTEYVYEFACLYGQYYHVGNSDKILEKVGEKLELPDQFLHRVGII